MVFLDLMPTDQHIHTFISGQWIRRSTTRLYPPPNESGFSNVRGLPLFMSAQAYLVDILA